MLTAYELVRDDPLEIRRHRLGASAQAILTAMALVGLGVLVMVPYPSVGAFESVIAAVAGAVNGYRAVFIKGVRHLTVVEEDGGRWLVADKRRIAASAIPRVYCAGFNKYSTAGGNQQSYVEYAVLIPIGGQAIELQANNHGHASKLSAALARALGVDHGELGPRFQSSRSPIAGLAGASALAAFYWLFNVPADAWSPVFAGSVSATLSVVLFIGNFGVAKVLSALNLPDRMT